MAFNFLNTGAQSIDAQCELVSEHFVRLTLKRPSHFHWGPGQTAYIITPGLTTLPFEAHPFTIASYDSSRDSKLSATASSTSGDKAVTEKEIREEAGTYWKEVVFLVNVRGGFTRRLADVAAKNGTIKTYLDGPYGPSPDLSRFDTSILIAGMFSVGINISFLKSDPDIDSAIFRWLWCLVYSSSTLENHLVC